MNCLPDHRFQRVRLLNIEQILVNIKIHLLKVTTRLIVFAEEFSPFSQYCCSSAATSISQRRRIFLCASTHQRAIMISSN